MPEDLGPGGCQIVTPRVIDPGRTVKLAIRCAAMPRTLLASVDGLRLTEMNENEVCCGFGGTFAVKYGEISDSIVTKKAENIEAAEPDMLIAGDLGCLMNMAGKLSRMGSTIAVRHVAEVLAGMTDVPPIGAPKPTMP